MGLKMSWRLCRKSFCTSYNRKASFLINLSLERRRLFANNAKIRENMIFVNELNSLEKISFNSIIMTKDLPMENMGVKKYPAPPPKEIKLSQTKKKTDFSFYLVQYAFAIVYRARLVKTLF